MPRRAHSLILASAMLALIACGSPMNDKVNNSSSLPGKSKGIPKDPPLYSGTQYTIGIVQFDNKIPVKISNAGEIATKILKEKLNGAGLKAILLDPKTSLEEEKLTAPLQSRNIKNISARASDDINDPDYRLSATITAYTEVEERIDTLVFQKKVIVARIVLEYTLIDLISGKSLLSESVPGEYRKDITDTSRSGSTPIIDSSFFYGALRDALGKSTEKMVRKLSNMPFQGKVLSVHNQDVILKAGTRSKLEESDQLDVYHLGEAILDLNSGKIIGYLESKVGVIEIKAHLDENLSKAGIVSGIGIQVGDIVRQTP